jgi:hypothetical protein
MSSLEVLQSCPTQWKALLKAIGGIDPTDMNLIIFYMEYHIPRLPYPASISNTSFCREEEYM